MNTTTRLAAMAFVVVVAAGGVLYLIGPGVDIGGPGATPTAIPTATVTPTSAPTPTSGPAATPVVIDRSTEAGYSIAIPAVWSSRANTGTYSGIFLSPLAPLVAGAIYEGGVKAGADPPEFVIPVGSGTGGTYELGGHDLAELLASMDAFYVANWSTHPTTERQATIDGEPAWVTETTVTGPEILWLDAVVIHGDRAMHVSLSAAPEHAAALREAFDELLASIRWTE